MEGILGAFLDEGKHADCGWDGEKALADMSDGTEAGRVFKNIDEDLPLVDVEGNKLSYVEYDAFSKGDDPLPPLVEGGRGPSRFVRDILGNVYYSNDHYESFQLVA